jgi:hypothetical protein
MEATGTYWKPVWHILSDGEFTLMLANATHVKNVAGRKTDVADAAGFCLAIALPWVPASDPANTEMVAALMARSSASCCDRLRKSQRSVGSAFDVASVDGYPLNGVRRRAHCMPAQVDWYPSSLARTNARHGPCATSEVRRVCVQKIDNQRIGISSALAYAAAHQPVLSR